MKRLYLFVLLFSCINFCVFGQTDFFNIKNQKIIAANHIKEIDEYWFADGANLSDSTNFDTMNFDKDGLCLSEMSYAYNYTYQYNGKGQKVKEIIRILDKSDSSIIVYTYDLKGNMILTETTKKWAEFHSPYDDYIFHKFNYDTQKQVLRKYWQKANGEQNQVSKYEYLKGADQKRTIRIVNSYDEYQKLNFTWTYLKNQVNGYLIDNGNIYLDNVSFLNSKGQTIKFINNRNYGPHAFDMVKKFGHGIVVTDTVMEIYEYNTKNLCTQNSTYKKNKLIEKFKWYFKQ